MEEINKILIEDEFEFCVTKEDENINITMLDLASDIKNVFLRKFN